MEEKKKSLKIIIMILAAVVFLVAVFFVYKKLIDKDTKESDKVNEMTPLLYKVTKEGSSNEMYLFGSIHMAKGEDLVFPSYIMDAYNKSHYVACEIDEESLLTDTELAQEVVMLMLYDDGTTIKDHLKEDTYNKLIEFLTKKNSYTNLYELYKPMFFYSTLSNIMAKDAGLAAESGIDAYFISKAKKDNKTVLEVESMKFQTDLLVSFSDKLYELIIDETLNNYDDSVKELLDLYEAWKKGDEAKILDLNDEEIKEDENYSKELKDEIENYNQKLIIDRNKSMADKAVEYFENNQDVFFMVGTLHIIGEDGLVNILKDRGYVVTQVTPVK